MIDYNDIEDYDSRYLTEECIQENEAIKDILNKFIRPVDKVLDLGCGTAFALDACKSIDRDLYIGVDVSENMIKRAREKYPDAGFINDKAENISKARFDVVLSIFSMPYIGEDIADVVYRSLKYTGIFIVVCYDKPYLNKASVYADRKDEYLYDIRPRLERSIKGFFRGGFTLVTNKELTESQTYRVMIFVKTSGKR